LSRTHTGRAGLLNAHDATPRLWSANDVVELAQNSTAFWQEALGSARSAMNLFTALPSVALK
jgi:hypothetical protein